MKGYCEGCGTVIDEVEFIQYLMCKVCYDKSETPRIKYRSLMIRKGNTDYYYTCDSYEWNFYLNRYYPKAYLQLTCEHLSNGNFELVKS